MLRACRNASSKAVVRKKELRVRHNCITSAMNCLTSDDKEHTSTCLKLDLKEMEYMLVPASWRRRWWAVRGDLVPCGVPTPSLRTPAVPCATPACTRAWSAPTAWPLRPPPSLASVALAWGAQSPACPSRARQRPAAEPSPCRDSAALNAQVLYAPEADVVQLYKRQGIVKWNAAPKSYSSSNEQWP